jgi:hypothetical protein
VTPVIGVLALQGHAAEHLRALAAAGVRAVPVRRPGELNAVHGLVIQPAPAHRDHVRSHTRPLHPTAALPVPPLTSSMRVIFDTT